MGRSNERYAPAASGPAYQEGHHWVSAFNFEKGLQAAHAFPQPLKIYDSTLRKIIYTPGVSPSIDDLLFIAEGLEEVGVRAMNLNIHWWGERKPEKKEFELSKALLSRRFGFRICIYPEAAVPGGSGSNNVVLPREALSVVRDLGADTVELTYKAPRDPDEVGPLLEQLASTISYAKSIGLGVVLGFADVARTDFDHVIRIANEGIKLGIERIQLSDSYSALSVDAMKLFCTRFRERLNSPVEAAMHVHNDFGLGTALALAAATSGLNPDVSMQSLSYRAGFASLEEVAVSLEVLYGQPTGIRLDRLQWLSDLISKRTGLPGNPLRPLTGEHAFLRDAPTAMVTYLTKGPDAFPTPNSCIPASLVGAKMSIVWGHHHATSTIKAKFQQMGLKASAAQVSEAYRRVEQEVALKRNYPQWLTEHEVEGICRKVMAAGPSP